MRVRGRESAHLGQGQEKRERQLKKKELASYHGLRLPDTTSFTTTCITTSCFNFSRLARGATWHFANDSALPEFVSHSRDFVRISVKNECKIRNVSISCNKLQGQYTNAHTHTKHRASAKFWLRCSSGYLCRMRENAACRNCRHAPLSQRASAFKLLHGYLFKSATPTQQLKKCAAVTRGT